MSSCTAVAPAAGCTALLFVGIAGAALSGGPAGSLLVAAGLAWIAFYLVWTGVVRLPAPPEALLLG